MSAKQLALNQLIAIRRQALEALRKDMMTLAHLTDEVRKKWTKAKETEEAFQEQLRFNETQPLALVPTQMLAWRRYWEHLQEQVVEMDDSLQKVSAELAKAQSAFEASYADVRTLERLAERRQHLEEQESQRLGYLAADDHEVLRISRKGNAHELG